MPCTLRKQGEMDTGAQCPSFNSAQDASLGIGAAHSQGGFFSLHSTHSRESLIEAPTVLSL